MDEATLNSGSTVTSTGSNWFSGLLDLAKTGAAAYTANREAKASRPVVTTAPTLPTTSTNWTPIALIGGGIALLLVLVFAFKK